MKGRMLTLLLALLVASGIGVAGVKGYWRLQDWQATQLLRHLQRADSLPPHQGVARATVATPRGWVTSLARVNYEGPGRWQIEYLSPGLARSEIGHQAQCLWQTRPDAPPAHAGAPTPISQNRQSPRVMRVQGAPSRGPVSGGDSLANYRVKFLGKAMVANRPCRVIGLADKESGRLLRVFWVDVEKGIALRQDRLGEGGRVMASTEFVSIAFPPSRNGSVSPPGRAKQGEDCAVGKRLGLEELSRRLGFQVGLPVELPHGFKLQDSYLYSCPCGCGGLSAHLRFSDGVRGFSLFEASKKTGHCVLAHGAALARGESVASPSSLLKAAAAERGEVLVVAIGDLPAATLKRIALSVPAVHPRVTKPGGAAPSGSGSSALAPPASAR